MEESGRGRRGARRGGSVQPRAVDYRRLSNPFAPQPTFSEDEIAGLHEAALDVLERLGLRVLLGEARAVYRSGGALVNEATGMVRIGREMVAAALAAAPRRIRLRAANPAREQEFAQGALLFSPGSGCPNVTDRLRGRRPGSAESYVETLRLQQSFDVIHMLGPSAEPQDIPLPLRHYTLMGAQLANGDKPMFVYARGRGQVQESFEMIRLARGLDAAGFEDGVWATTVINTNSPRQLDVPMAQGILDFARAGQMAIITPFCLAGAMAPITVAGALVLQHAEALGGIVLAQLARAGAPVCYGSFASNVDMRSGAPAFGTPEHMRATLGSGQLARLIGLPWRAAAGTAANMADAQGAGETAMALWAAVLAQATVAIHAAGWLEGGLSFGYEKFVLDVEMLQTIAELCRPEPADAAARALEAIAEVEPGGHFFAAGHTMARYGTAFYEPLVADRSNFGSWSEAGRPSADERATAVWQKRLAEFEPPASCAGAAGRLEGWVADRVQAGGVPAEG